MLIPHWRAALITVDNKTGEWCVLIQTEEKRLYPLRLTIDPAPGKHASDTITEAIAQLCNIDKTRVRLKEEPRPNPRKLPVWEYLVLYDTLEPHPLTVPIPF